MRNGCKIFEPVGEGGCIANLLVNKQIALLQSTHPFIQYKTTTSLTWLATIVILLQLGVLLLPAYESLTPPVSHYTYSYSRRKSQCNLATSNNEKDKQSSSLNMDKLRKRMERQENQYAELLGGTIKVCWKFNIGTRITYKQHVHTIEFPKGTTS